MVCRQKGRQVVLEVCWCRMYYFVVVGFGMCGLWLVIWECEVNDNSWSFTRKDGWVVVSDQ